MFEGLFERQPQTIYRPGGFLSKLVSSRLISDLLRCRLRNCSFIAQLCIYYCPALLLHPHWLATSLRAVSQQVWVVVHAWWSMAWAEDQKGGRERKEDRRKKNTGLKYGERMNKGPWFISSADEGMQKKKKKIGGIIGLEMIRGRSWMHFSDAVPGIVERVWMCMGRVSAWGRQKKGQNKSVAAKHLVARQQGFKQR